MYCKVPHPLIIGVAKQYKTSTDQMRMPTAYAFLAYERRYKHVCEALALYQKVQNQYRAQTHIYYFHTMFIFKNSL